MLTFKPFTGLKNITDEIELALGGLIDRDLVTVRRTELWVEVEIKSDILFASGFSQGALMSLDAGLRTTKRVAGVIAMGRLDSIRDNENCRDTTCSNEASELVDSYNGMRTISSAGFIAVSA